MRLLRNRLVHVAFWWQLRVNQWYFLFFFVVYILLIYCKGVDFPDIKIVCMAGLSGSIVNILQRGGRALHNSDDHTLFIIFYEPWVHDISLDEYSEGNLGDPDRPRGPLKSSSQRRNRAPLSCLKLVQGTHCLRAEFASYPEDTSQSGMG